MTKKFKFKKLLSAALLFFVLMNAVAFFHAYAFTHFNEASTRKTATPHKLSLAQKFKALLLGIENPKPQTKHLPDKSYEILLLQTDEKIASWLLKTNESTCAERKIAILFHGYGSEKSSMLERASFYNEKGYDALLVDFRGAGGSTGNECTIGFKEAEEVKAAYDAALQLGYRNIHLMGNSMGAVAVMRAISIYKLSINSLLIECPFGTMSETVGQRFDNMKVPRFPMAQLLVFWGGVQNGFCAFNHNPQEYAKAIKIPTLLMWGAKDKSVSKAETYQIFENLAGQKYLFIFPEAGHEDYLEKYNEKWQVAVSKFLQENTTN